MKKKQSLANDFTMKKMTIQYDTKSELLEFVEESFFHTKPGYFKETEHSTGNCTNSKPANKGN